VLLFFFILMIKSNFVFCKGNVLFRVGANILSPLILTNLKGLINLSSTSIGDLPLHEITFNHLGVLKPCLSNEAKLRMIDKLNSSMT